MRGVDITLEQYEDLLKEQENRCAICSLFLDGYGSAEKLHVDHDHTTGKVRGLLCLNCNHMIGKAKDSVEIMMKGALYLQTHKGVVS